MFLVLLPNSVVKLDYNLQNENAHYLTENSSKTKFIYTATQWERTITHAFKKNICKVQVLLK